MTKIDRRESHMQTISSKVATKSGVLPARTHIVSPLDKDKLPYTNPKERYHISPSQRYPLDIEPFLQENSGDPALKVSFKIPISRFQTIHPHSLQNFYSRLQDHMLARILRLEYDGDEHEFTDDQRRTIIFRNNRLYRHRAFRVNFTTYDIRRSQDSFNPRTQHCDIMVRARDDPSSPGYHPFWYGRIVGVFHANVMRNEPDNERDPDWKAMQFLWIRWLGRSDTHTRHGINPRRLDRIGFVTESDDTEPFGFLDPAHVVRACHLIPAFAHGRTTELLGPSIARTNPDEMDDWLYYYVGR